MSGDGDYQINTNWWSDVQTMVSAAATMVPVAGSLLGGLVNIFWPQQTTDFWDQVKDQVEALIEQDLEQSLLDRIQQQLSGLSNESNDYLTTLQNSAGDPDTIKETWITTFEAYEGAEPSFMIAPSQGSDEDRVIILPLFAQFANLKIALLRDVCHCGVSWGMTSEFVASKAAQLTSDIKTYVTYATGVYNTGCALPKNNPTQNNHLCEPFRSNNAYVRLTTLTVMDFVTAWPYLDITTYPNGTSYTLDREIFSDPFGTCDNSGPVSLTPSWQALPSTPTGYITFVECWAGGYINSLQLTYTENGGPNGATQTARMGSVSGGGNRYYPRGASTAIGTGQYMVSAQVDYGSVIASFSTGFVGQGTLPVIKCQGTNSNGPGPTIWSYSNHYISRIHINGVSNYYNCADCMVFGFRVFPSQTGVQQGLEAMYRATPGSISVADFVSNVKAAQVDLQAFDVAQLTADRSKILTARQAMFAKSK